jgi:predicted chitinase
MPGLSLSRASQLVAGCNAAMHIGEINTVRRCAMFLAQIGHESVSLQYKQEIQPPPGASYPPYIGRTFIQVTWNYNYRDFGYWCHGKNLLGDPNLFLNYPAALAADQWAWLGPIWYWTVARPTLNQMADNGDMLGCTRAINGGLNGLDDRTQRYRIALNLGAAILPTALKPPPPEDPMPTQLQLSTSAKKRTKVPGGSKWTTVGWDEWSPKGASGGASTVLGDHASMFALTAWFYVNGLEMGDNLYVRVQTLTRTGKPTGQYPIAEMRATSGQSCLSYSQVGGVAPNTNLRLLVSATKACTITSAWWRTLYW